jgi:hypothetical protein
VRRSIVDGDRWIKDRLGFLRSLLEDDHRDLTEEQRAAIEAEMATLSKERGIHHGGPGLPRGLRRLLGVRGIGGR